MSAEKKVLLLSLSLIILIIVCVYTHLPSFTNESQSNKIDSSNVEVVQKEIDNLSKDDTKPNDNKNSEDTKDKKDNETDTKNETSEELVEEQIKEEPLITTDERYSRVEPEKNIEDLSITTQKLQIKMNDYVRSNPIVFTRGSYKITKKSNKTIDEVVKALKEFPSIRIEVAGHTDAIGAAKVNQNISQARARTVKNRLIKLGIEKERVVARGYGEDIPLVENSPKGYSKINRRVEFNIVEE